MLFLDVESSLCVTHRLYLLRSFFLTNKKYWEYVHLTKVESVSAVILTIKFQQKEIDILSAIKKKLTNTTSFQVKMTYVHYWERSNLFKMLLWWVIIMQAQAVCLKWIQTGRICFLNMFSWILIRYLKSYFSFCVLNLYLCIAVCLIFLILFIYLFFWLHFLYLNDDTSHFFFFNS